MLDKASYTPLYIQVREYILNRIRMGDYKVGDRLPTEKELMEQLQVGRQPCVPLSRSWSMKARWKSGTESARL